MASTRFQVRVVEVKEKGTVLVVDDYTPAREAVRSALEEEFHCLSADSAKQGLEMLKTHPVDAVILDINMPEMDGIEALKRMREMGMESQVLLLTGQGSLETAQKAMRYGAFDYLTKPFRVGNLRERVREAIRKRRLLEKEGMEDELEELSRALTAKLAEACRLARRSEVSAEALTEMKNPLIAILGYTQMLLQKVSDRRFKFLSTKSMRYLGIIEEEAKRCVEIASRLMSLSEQEGIRDAAKVNDVLPNVAALLRPQCSLSGIELRTTLLKKDVVVDVPYDDTHTVLVNLMLNSMEAIEGAGEISLKGYQVPAGTLLLTMASEGEREFMDGVSEKSLVAVEVSDTGRGIDPKHVDRIFDLFFTTKTDSPGAGIGLAVCKERVELSGGHIAVVSTGASGTTMRVLLPVSTLV